MKVKVLLIAAAILAFAAMSFAQIPFTAPITNLTPLTDQCPLESGTPLPDGTIVKIFWDQNYATRPGPDPADVQPVADQSVPNGVNFNEFPINGEVDMGMPGCFFTTNYFQSSSPAPSVPAYYLLIVYCNPNTGLGDSIWSNTFVLACQQCDEVLPVWNCHNFVCTQPCQATPSWNWNYSGHAPSQVGLSQCVTLCAEPLTFSITVAGNDAGRIPVVSVVPGCVDCGNPTCTPASFHPVAAPAVVVNPTNIVYTYTIVPITEGCACVKFDAILAAQITNVAMLPGDNSVKVSFTSLSETNMKSFQILRDGAAITELAAEGGATSHDYSYTDNTAMNGTSYSYVIRAINLDNTTTDLATSSVTPGADHMVVTEYKLHQNYPNPFNPTTSIRFDLVDRNFVTLKIYNATGQEVATVVNRECKAGVNVVNYDATSLTSGLYFYTVKIGNEYSATKKMLLLK